MFSGVGVGDWKYGETHMPKNTVKSQGTTVIKTLEDLMVIASIAILPGSPHSKMAGTWLTPGNVVVTCPVPPQQMKTWGLKVFL